MFCPSFPHWRQKHQLSLQHHPLQLSVFLSLVRGSICDHFGAALDVPPISSNMTDEGSMTLCLSTWLNLPDCLYFVSAQVIPSPFDHSHVVTTTTHKTLRAVRYWQYSLIILKFVVFILFLCIKLQVPLLSLVLRRNTVQLWKCFVVTGMITEVIGRISQDYKTPVWSRQQIICFRRQNRLFLVHFVRTETFAYATVQLF